MEKIDHSHFIYQNLKRVYPVIERGEGCYIFDVDGKRYIDGAAGGVCAVTLGHGVREIIEAMQAQAEKLSFAHISVFATTPQLSLAREIAAFSPGELNHVYFVSTGTEATELGIKMARTYHLIRGNPSKHKVISRWRGYHGSSLGALSYSGRSLRRHKYYPYYFDAYFIPPPYCYRCPFGKEYPACGLSCAYELEVMVKQLGPDYVSAFIAEPIINNIAAVIPPPEYFKIVRDICDRYDIVMVMDEVITGFGRTGKNFGIEHWGVVPDIIAVGKGISSGYSPLAAAIVHEKIYGVFEQGPGITVLGYTYAGNPLSCAVGLAVLKYLEEHELVERVARMGPIFMNKLSRLREQPIVGDIRGKGLLVGIEFVADKEKKMPFPREKKVVETVASIAFQKGLTFGSVAGDADGVLGDAIIVAPAFTVEEKVMEDLVSILEETIIQVQKKLGY